MGRIGEQRQVAVDVGIDQSWRDDQAGRVDTRFRLGAIEPADGGDPVAGNADVGFENGKARPVNDAAAVNQGVEHRGVGKGAGDGGVIVPKASLHCPRQ